MRLENSDQASVIVKFINRIKEWNGVCLPVAGGSSEELLIVRHEVSVKQDEKAQRPAEQRCAHSQQ